MFLIYINDITSQVSNIQDAGGIAPFADDTKVYSTRGDILQSSLNIMEEWFDKRQLVVAPHKCFHLQIGKPRVNDISCSFTICKVTVTNTSHMKDLGIIVSQNLKWSAHISKITKEGSFMSYQIRKGFKTRNIWTLVSLFKTYIRPKLELEVGCRGQNGKKIKIDLEPPKKFI